jgi:hypothetical protein
MPRSDLSQPSPPRVELDQRSRDARLRLEHVERRLLMRPLPRRPLLDRVLRWLGFRGYSGEHLGGREASGGRLRQERPMPGETGGGADNSSAVLPVSWPNCPTDVRVSLARLGPVAPNRDPTARLKVVVCQDRERQLVQPLPLADRMLAAERLRMRAAHRSFASWVHWCGRGDLNSHVLSDNRF